MRMRIEISRAHRMVVAFAFMTAVGCGGDPAAEDELAGNDIEVRQGAVTDASLALHWAPIHYQDVNKKSGTGANGHSDYVVPFNYDGDFNGRNNWDHLDQFTFSSKVQFSIAEVTSHWFITYMFYHPRDWAAGTADEHENDTEAVVMMVRKDGSTFGVLEGLVTTYHEFRKSYTAASYIGKGPCNPETPPPIVFEQGHPRTYQEPEGHGLIGCTASTACVKNDDGIRYFPAGIAGVPPNVIPDGQQVTVNYSLTDMAPLIAHRWDSPTFVNPNTFAGDSSGTCGEGLSTCSDNAADGVWFPSDSRIPNTTQCNPLKTLPGEDWAAFMIGYFSSSQLQPTDFYLRNPFLHAKCEGGRRMEGSTDSCVQSICSADPYCCRTAWDGVCVQEVTTVCNKSCSNCLSPSGQANICTTKTTPIGNGCDSKCAQQICAADPHCCNNAWDSICVSKVGSICGLGC
jgi:hypothetical protein